VHGLASSNKDVSEVARHHLNLALVVLAVLVQEIELKDLLCRAENSVELIRVIRLGSHQHGEVQSQIKVRMGHDINEVNGGESVTFATTEEEVFIAKEEVVKVEVFFKARVSDETTDNFRQRGWFRHI